MEKRVDDSEMNSFMIIDGFRCFFKRYLTSSKFRDISSRKL